MDSPYRAYEATSDCLFQTGIIPIVVAVAAVGLYGIIMTGFLCYSKIRRMDYEMINALCNAVNDKEMSKQKLRLHMQRNKGKKRKIKTSHIKTQASDYKEE